MHRKRIREYGIIIGNLNPGRNNAITDVEGVRVGHTTVIHDGAGAFPPGKGPARTGVTVILPHAGDVYMKKAHAAVHTINGHGKVFGFEQVREIGVIESPIALTGTFNVGLVADSLVRYMTENNPAIGTTTECLSLNVLVGETNDGFLNDMKARFVRYEHVRGAILKALNSGDFAPVDEGSVGAGTGCHTYRWKGGIGTASRMLPDDLLGYTVGVLVQSNFGLPHQLTIKGTHIGENLTPENYSGQERLQSSNEKGSIMVVMATDAPLNERQLERLCRRVPVGLARTGSHIGHQSGDFCIAFTTKNLVDHHPQKITETREEVVNDNEIMPWLFQAVIECVEEAVLNALFKAVTKTGREGHTLFALPIERVIELMKDEGDLHAG